MGNYIYQQLAIMAKNLALAHCFPFGLVNFPDKFSASGGQTSLELAEQIYLVVNDKTIKRHQRSRMTANTPSFSNVATVLRQCCCIRFRATLASPQTTPSIQSLSDKQLSVGRCSKMKASISLWSWCRRPMIFLTSYKLVDIFAVTTQSWKSNLRICEGCLFSFQYFRNCATTVMSHQQHNNLQISQSKHGTQCAIKDLELEL